MSSRLAFVLLLALAAACSERQPSPSRPAPAAVKLSPAVDVVALSRRARLAFRVEDGGFRARADAYDVGVDADGVTFTPVVSTSEDEPPVLGEALALGRSEVTRGDASLRDDARGFRFSTDGSLVEGERGVREVLENGDDGLEQRWHFRERPEGAGDVVVRVPVSGLSFVASTESGLHFQGADGLGVRYGHATWVDAKARRTSLPAVFAGDHIELVVPGALVDESAYPAVLDPKLYPETAVDEPVAGRAASGHEGSFGVAYGGGVYLVAWCERGFSRTSGKWALWATRVTPEGEILDAAGFKIAADIGDQNPVSVLFDGTGFYVVWAQTVEGNVYGARVTTAGVVLDPNGRDLTTGTIIGCGYPAAAFNGSQFLVVFEKQTAFANADLYGVRVSTSNTLLTPTPFAINNLSGNQSRVKVASDGNEWMVFWSDDRSSTSSYRTRVTSSGSVVSSNGVFVGSAVAGVSYDGTDYVVAAGGSTVRLRRMTGSGAWMDPDWIEVADNGAGIAHSASPSFDGTHYLVVWDDARPDAGATRYSVRAARMTSDGTALDPTGVRIGVPLTGDSTSHYQVSSVAVTDGATFLVPWVSHYSYTSFDVHGVRVDAAPADLTVLDSPAMVLSSVVNRQILPTVAFDGSTYLVAWLDDRAQVYNALYAARVDVDGAVIDDPPFFVADDAASPVATFDGTQFVLAWYSGASPPGVVAARVSGDGSVLDDPPVQLYDIPESPWVAPVVAAGGGGQTVVAWTTASGVASSGRDVFVGRIGNDGAALDPGGVVVSDADGDQYAEAIASDGSNVLLLWRDAVSGALEAARLDAALVQLDDPPLTLATGASNAAVSFGDPSESPDVAHFRATWLEGGSARSTRVSTAGALLDVTPADLGASGRRPAAAFDGSAHLVLLTTSTSVTGVRIGGDGTVLDVPPFDVGTVVAPPSGYAGAAIASGPSQRSLVAYPVNAPGVGPSRLRVRVLSTVPNQVPVAEAQALQTDEDVNLAVTLSATDGDGEALSYTIETPPAHGSLSGTGSNRTYRPAANYFGPDSFTFVASDGFDTSLAATVDITVVSVNDVPVAQSQSLTTKTNVSKAVTLVASDVETPALTWSIVTPPTHGALSGTAPALTYEPATDYDGPDSFTFRVNDGEADSNDATVSITVQPNAAPVVDDKSATLNEDSSRAVTLTGSDANGDTITFSIVSGPSHGALGGAPPSVTYTPDADYNGSDSLTYEASDGELTSSPATVSLTINAVNDAPVATPQSVTVPEDGEYFLALGGTDVDGDSLSAEVVSQPSHGSVTSPSPGLFRYRPAADYFGPDSFTFRVRDGLVSSAAAVISIDVTAVNDPPVATAQSLTLDEDTSLAVTLSGSDVEGSALTFTVVTPPTHGALTGTPPTLTYTPAQDYFGPDSFAFEADDGEDASAPALVSLTVLPVDEPPAPDAGPTEPDAGEADAGDADAGPTAEDAGDADAGPIEHDAGQAANDAGASGSDDAGQTTSDAGPALPDDAGPTEADAGGPPGGVDAGHTSAPPAADAGDNEPVDEGCGCRSTGTPADAWLALLLPLALVVAGRRRRR